MLRPFSKTKFVPAAALVQTLGLSLLLCFGAAFRALADDSPTQQATKYAQIEADQAKRDVNDKKNYVKEIDKKDNNMEGKVFFDCHLQWVKHQDPFGMKGLDGDVALQFHVTENKAGTWKPIDQTMVLTFFSDSAHHQDNFNGTITVDGQPITFSNGQNYHTNKPWGVSKQGQALEVVDFPISYDELISIATGHVVKGNMGGVDFDVKDFQQGVFRELYHETMPPPKAPAPAANN